MNYKYSYFMLHSLAHTGSSLWTALLGRARSHPGDLFQYRLRVLIGNILSSAASHTYKIRVSGSEAWETALLANTLGGSCTEFEDCRHRIWAFKSDRPGFKFVLQQFSSYDNLVQLHAFSTPSIFICKMEKIHHS